MKKVGAVLMSHSAYRQSSEKKARACAKIPCRVDSRSTGADRQTDRLTVHRQTDRQAGRRQADRKTDTQTNSHTHTDGQTQADYLFHIRFTIFTCPQVASDNLGDIEWDSHEMNSCVAYPRGTRLSRAFLSSGSAISKRKKTLLIVVAVVHVTELVNTWVGMEISREKLVREKLYNTTKSIDIL